MSGKTTLSSNGVTTVIGVKMSLWMNDVITNLSANETRHNKSEMIRLLLEEALKERGIVDETTSETTSETTE